MYLESDKHCRECICPSCDLFQTDGCLEGDDNCEKCLNDCPTNFCWWHPDERGEG